MVEVLIGLALLSLMLGFGAAIVRCLPLRLTIVESGALTVVIGLLGGTWLIWPLCLVLPYTVAVPIAELILAVVIIWLRARWRLEIVPLKLSRLSQIAWASASVLWLLLFVVLFSTHAIVGRGNELYSAGSAWADFGLHTSLINHFVTQSRLQLDFPLFAGAKLTYPFLINFLSSLLVRQGWSMAWSITIPSLLLITAFFSLIVSLVRRLSGSVAGGLIGINLFLFSGSAAGWLVAVEDWRNSASGLGRFLANLPATYSDLYPQNLHFSNPIANILLPQRPFLFGFATVSGVLILLQSARDEHHQRTVRASLVLAGILIGLLPLAHPHSFIAAMGFLGIAALDQWRNKLKRGWWLAAIGIAVVLAFPQVMWQQWANGLSTGGHWAWGWMVQPNESIWGFWWRNFGLLGPGLVIAAAAAWRLPKWRPWVLGGCSLAALANIYAIQPFSYDNLKLILYGILMVCLLGGTAAVSLIKRRPIWTAAILPMVFLITATGSLVVLREFQINYQFASAQDLELANWAKTNTPPAAIFMTSNRPNHPISTLAGRTIVAGYDGWLYNFNLPYGPRNEAVAKLMSGTAEPDTPTYNAAYLAASVVENSSGLDALSGRYKLLYRNSVWQVFALTP